MIRAFQWDLARQVERLDWLIAQLPRYAEWGYQELHLHLEDAVDYPSLPGVARSDAYSWSQFERLVTAADEAGITVVPIANLLGHTQYLIKTPEWRELNELQNADGSPAEIGQICPDHPRTLEVAQKLINDLRPLCTAGKLHVGLDESFHLGKHPSSRAQIEQQGLPPYFSAYVTRLNEQVNSAGLKMAIWADMLIMLPEAIESLPTDIAAYDWYYHGFARHPRFAHFNFQDSDLAEPLRQRGIDYWACPMNGAFRHEPLPVFGERLANAVSWWKRAAETKAAGFLVSSWEPSHLTPELTTVIDAAIAGLWLDGDTHDHATLLRRGFRRATSIAQPAKESRLALACDERAFAGYAQAERHTHWDTSPLHEGSARESAKVRFFDRATKRAQFEPLRISLQWRRYLARRECLVRSAAAGVLRARRQHARGHAEEGTKLLHQLHDDAVGFVTELREGQAAADALWQLTRRQKPAGPNHKILQQDRQKLTAWQRWLERALRSPARLHTPSPILGGWQLSLTVHATRPNANIVVVQQQNADGNWVDLRQRHTIEFRSNAARRCSPLKRDWSLPIEDPKLPLRITLRGLGEVAISEVSLTNGPDTKWNKAWAKVIRKRLGHPAPESGWPGLDWTTDQDVLELIF